MQNTIYFLGVDSVPTSLRLNRRIQSPLATATYQSRYLDKSLSPRGIHQRCMNRPIKCTQKDHVTAIVVQAAMMP